MSFSSFAQSQIDDKDRTIKMQQNKLEQLEKAQQRDLHATASQQQTTINKTIEMANCATQTERVSRSKFNLLCTVSIELIYDFSFSQSFS